MPSLRWVSWPICSTRLFGELPSGARLARIVQSPNYADGVLHNQLDTPMLTTDESRVSLMLSSSFSKQDSPRPLGAILSSRPT